MRPNTQNPSGQSDTSVRASGAVFGQITGRCLTWTKSPSSTFNLVAPSSRVITTRYRLSDKGFFGPTPSFDGEVWLYEILSDRGPNKSGGNSVGISGKGNKSSSLLSWFPNTKRCWYGVWKNYLSVIRLIYCSMLTSSSRCFNKSMPALNYISSGGGGSGVTERSKALSVTYYNNRYNR